MRSISDEKVTCKKEIITPEEQAVLTRDAMSFLAMLHNRFEPRRKEILQARKRKQNYINEGHPFAFPAEMEKIRQDPNWKIAATPKDLEKRWVEITGPTDKKMVINALNSGADVFMADFEDSNSPTWENMIQGQANLTQAIDRTLEFTNPAGKKYTLNNQIATLFVRPRGWHLNEKRFLVNGEPISGSLFDFGLYFFHNARRLINNGTGPYFYLPKLEDYFEARLWNEVFVFAQDTLGIPQGTIKATVLIETIGAAHCMEEILYELKDHSAGLNAGRWDYIFSIIKKFQGNKEFVFPDRDQVTMTTPFMRAYANLLVKTCHARQAHAIGGMAAYIPSRKDPEVNEVALQKVREDKKREAHDGFDGTWVAHPDLVPIAREEFQKVLGEKANQKENRRDDVTVSPEHLQNFDIPGGTITEKGVRNNIDICLRYLDSWLRGIGAAAIYNLMEDLATAEISRSQLWQWVHHKKGKTEDGKKIDASLFKTFLKEELEKVKAETASLGLTESKWEKAKTALEHIVLDEAFVDFLPEKIFEYLG